MEPARTLDGLERLLLECCRVGGMVRYMDNVVWWCESRAAAREALAAARAFLRDDLLLEVKEPAQLGRSAGGLAYCGDRVLPGALLLSRRRRRRYAERRRHWEGAYAAGEIDAAALQAGFGSVRAITAHADAAAWRPEQIGRRPLAGALCAV